MKKEEKQWMKFMKEDEIIPRSKHVENIMVILETKFIQVEEEKLWVDENNFYLQLHLYFDGGRITITPKGEDRQMFLAFYFPAGEIEREHSVSHLDLKAVDYFDFNTPSP